MKIALTMILCYVEKENFKLKGNAISDVHVFHSLVTLFAIKVKPTPIKLQVLTEMPLPKTNKELQSFLGIIKYFNKIPPGNAEVYKPQRG